MSKKLWRYLIFFIALTVVFLIFVFAGTDNWKVKPITISTVRPFSFIKQDGNPFTQDSMLGKVCVVNYFFTSCRGICPHMNGNLKTIYEAFKDAPDFMIVSHTSDPETDSAQRLQHYADSMGVDPHHWVFLTGRKDSLYKAARDSYLLDDPKNAVVNINDQFLHTQFVALVDKKGNVRGQVYDGLKQDELDKLKRDIKELLQE